MNQRKQPFTLAHITEDLHMQLKKVEEEFEHKLGKRIALVAYEANEQK